MQLSRGNETEEFKIQLANLEKLHNLKLESDELRNKELDEARKLNNDKNKELDEVRTGSLKALREKMNDAERNRDIMEAEALRLKEKGSKRRDFDSYMPCNSYSLPIKRETSSEEAPCCSLTYTHTHTHTPIKRETSSEEDSDELSIGLDSDGEIPDYSQYTKEQLELQALKCLAKKKNRKYGGSKKVTLTKNTHSRRRV
eukprot:GHVR01180856.1.p1 GENE.GHVR01180856.1~~GHVR01180856.1.p1  ORF type:complete len:200 (+),score=41.19 GHVR01180856.1:274-873(+)